MYSIKATRIHVKNGASLSAPAPILRSTSPPVTPAVLVSSPPAAAATTRQEDRDAFRGTQGGSNRTTTQETQTSPEMTDRTEKQSPLPQYQSSPSSPLHKSISVKITVTSPTRKQTTRQPQLQASLVQSPTRVRSTPNLQYTHKQVPLFYSPLLMRHLKELEAEKSNKKDKQLFNTSTHKTPRKLPSFNCLHPSDDSILPDSTYSSFLSNKDNNSSSNNSNNNHGLLFLDLLEDHNSSLDPPSATDLMTHEQRWNYQSNLAGHHQQNMESLDLSHSIQTSPVALLYGVPPQAASIIKILKYNATHLESHTIPFLLQLIGRIFPKLVSLTLIESTSMNAIIICKEEPRRLFILRHLPYLNVINDIQVTEEERRQIHQETREPTTVHYHQGHEYGSMIEGFERELSIAGPPTVVSSLHRTKDESLDKKMMDTVDETCDDDPSLFHPLFTVKGRCYSWSHSDLSDPLDLRPSHSADDIDYLLDDLTQDVMKMKIEPFVRKTIDKDTATTTMTTTTDTVNSHNRLSEDLKRKSIEFMPSHNCTHSFSDSISDDGLTSESSLGHQPSWDHYISSTDSRADSPMPVQYRIKCIENRLMVKRNDSENDSFSGEDRHSQLHLKRMHHDPATSRRPHTRMKKDSSLPPTSPASIPRVPSYRIKKQKRPMTASNMETLRKRKPIVDQLLDDDDEEEEEEEEDHECSSHGDIYP